MNLDDLFKEIKLIAIEQGELLEQAFHDESTVASIVKDNENWSDLDVVTILDKRIEEVFYSRLSDKFPELGFNLEEQPELNNTDAEYVAYIDPIDGTKYFAKDVPLFATSVGILRKGEPVLGVVYDAVSNQLYAGAEGHPTTMNEKQVTVSDTTDLSQAILSVDYSTHKENWDTERDWMNRKLVELNNAAKRIRLFGQGALSNAWVSSGGIDGFVSLWGHGSKPFDIAAGKALIKYAGGKTIDLEIPEIKEPRFIGGNAKLVDQIAELMLKN